MADGSLRISDSPRLVSNDFFKSELKRTRLAKGDVLVTIVGSIGRSTVVPHDPDFALQRSVAVIKPSEVAPDYLSLYLRSPGAKSFYESRGRGTAQMGIYLRDLKLLPVPFPPLAEQHCIAQAVERVFGKRDEAEGHIELAELAVRRFRQSVLAAACSGRLTADWREVHASEQPPSLDPEPKRRPTRFRSIDAFHPSDIPRQWRWVQVEDLLPPGGIFDGPFGSNLKSSDYTEAGARVIRLENIGHLTFINSKRTYVSDAKYKALLKHSVHPGDVMFSSFVEEQVRACLIPPGLEDQAIAKADCFTLRPADAVLPDYLVLQLASPQSHRMLTGAVHGATRPRVNTTDLRSLPIALCSLTEQAEIVRRHRELTALADGAELRLKSARQRADRSAQAILVKAFRGELVHEQEQQSEGSVTTKQSELVEPFKSRGLR